MTETKYTFLCICISADFCMQPPTCSNHYSCAGEEFLELFHCNTTIVNSDGIPQRLCLDPLTYTCDGVPQCPDASDEGLDLCEKYSPTANFVICQAASIYNNITMNVRAVRCNGISECESGEDENGCDVDKDTLLISILLGLVVILIISIMTVKCIEGYKSELVQDRSVVEAFSKEPNIEKLQALVVVSQTAKLRKWINIVFFQVIVRVHKADYREALNSLKVASFAVTSIVCNIQRLLRYRSTLIL